MKTFNRTTKILDYNQKVGIVFSGIPNQDHSYLTTLGEIDLACDNASFRFDVYEMEKILSKEEAMRLVDKILKAHQQGKYIYAKVSIVAGDKPKEITRVSL